MIVGDQVLLWLAALGVAAVLQGHPILFKSLQYAGAAYLVFVGVRLIFSRGASAQPIPIRAGHLLPPGTADHAAESEGHRVRPALFLVVHSIVTQQGAVTFAAMAVTIAVLTLAYCLTLVGFAHALTAQVRRHHRVARALERMAGVVLVAFGIRLVQ